MTRKITNLIEEIHDLSIKIDLVIDDDRLARYLPNRHKFLRRFYRTWLTCIILSFICTILSTSSKITSTKTLIEFLIILSFSFTIIIAITTGILYLARYSISIGECNEVKAKFVKNIKVQLNDKVQALQDEITSEVIKNTIKFTNINDTNIYQHIDTFIKTAFPTLKIIKSIYKEKILDNVIKSIDDYIDDLGRQIKTELENDITAIKDLAEKRNVNENLLVLVINRLVKQGRLEGTLSEDELKFIPKKYSSPLIRTNENLTDDIEITPPTTDTNTPRITQSKTDLEDHAIPSEEISSIPTDINKTQTASIETQINDQEETFKPPSENQIENEIQTTKNRIEQIKAAYENGKIGVDSYIVKIQNAEKHLAYLEFKLKLVKNVEDPTSQCIICFNHVEPDEDLIRCPNNHVLHQNCALDFLTKHENCPWCETKIKTS
ncbi:MAG: RING finger protein [Promethearchaeota archaeon]